MAVVRVELAGRGYDVRVERGLLSRLAHECGALLRKTRVPIVTDANVHAAWGNPVEASLRAAGHEPRWHILAPGEASKS